MHPLSNRQYPTSEWLIISSVTAFTGGILAAEHLPFSPYVRWAIILAIATIIFVFHLKQKSIAATFFLLPLFFCLGSFFAGKPDPPLNPLHIYNQIDNTHQETTITGILTECPQIGAEKTRLRVAVEQIILPSEYRPAKGLVQLTIPGTIPKNIKPGDHLIAKARFSKVNNYGTPGAFDYKNFLGSQSIWITGWIQSPALIMRLNTIPPRSISTNLRYLPERVRYHINSFLNKNLENRARGLYKSILTGDRIGLSPETIDNFKAAGTFHLLAISGLHVGLLYTLSFFVIAWLLKQSTRLLLRIPLWKTAALLSLIPLTAYSFVAGFQTPVVRALIMASVFIIAYVANRQWSIPVNIGIGAWLILIVKPEDIHNASFQLSFAAVVSIAIICPRIEHYIRFQKVSGPQSVWARHLTHIKKWTLASFAISIAAMLGTAPFLLLHFNRFSLLSPVSTILIEPFLCLWGLIFGLTGCLFIAIFPPLAVLLFKIGAWGLLIAEKITSWLAAIPFNSIWLATPSRIEIFFYLILIASVLNWKRFRAAKPAVIFSLCMLMAFPLYYYIERKNRDTTEVTFIDVGQGTSTLLELPGGNTTLIDGGGPYSPQFNVGEQIIAPFLWQKRITKIDTFIVTHPHADHYNGLFFLLRHFRPDTIWTNGETNVSWEYDNLLRLAKELHINVKTPMLHETLFNNNQVRIKNIGEMHLREGLSGKNKTLPMRQNHNNMSLVIRIDHGEKSFLLPGDIDQDIEAFLAETSDSLSADVLLAPHHGSATSNSAIFLQKVSPHYAVISLGRNQVGEYAPPAVIKRYRNAGSKLYKTATHGTVSFNTDGNNLSVQTYYP